MISSYYSIFVQTVANLSPWQSLIGEPSTEEQEKISTKPCFLEEEEASLPKKIRKKKEYKLLAKVQIHSSASKILLYRKKYF